MNVEGNTIIPEIANTGEVSPGQLPLYWNDASAREIQFNSIQFNSLLTKMLLLIMSTSVAGVFIPNENRCA